MKTCKITVSEAIIEFFKNQYLQDQGSISPWCAGYMGIFGHGNVSGIGQALSINPQIPFYRPKTEQAMVHASTAFTKAKRGRQFFINTTSIGPGATNLVTGAATATTNRLPVLLLPGDTFSTRKCDPVLQQLERADSIDTTVNDSLRSVSVYWDRIHRPEQLMPALVRCLQIFSRPSQWGAVTLCIPQDVATESFEFPEIYFHKKVWSLHKEGLHPKDLKHFHDVLAQAERPLIIAGGGVHYANATSLLKTFVENTQIPLTETQAGKGVIPGDHPQNMGGIGVTGTFCANTLAQKADLIIGMGTRYSDFTTSSHRLFENSRVKFININSGHLDAQKMGAIPIQCDLETFLQDALECSYKASSTYLQEYNQFKKEWKSLKKNLLEPESTLNQCDAIGILNHYLSKNPGSLIHAAGSLPGDLHQLWDANHKDEYFSEYAYSCMGHEISGALGLKMAKPQSEIYAFVGDGSYLMMSQEIFTSIQEKLKITILLFDNGGYQCIQNLQVHCGGENYGNRFASRENTNIEGEIAPIDFAQNAQSFGAHAITVTTPQELTTALEVARKNNKTTLIWIKLNNTKEVPSHSSWDVPVWESGNHQNLEEARARYENEDGKRRIYY